MEKLHIKLKRSLAKRNPNHIKTVHSLGLRRIGILKEFVNNASLQGKLKQVSYLLDIK